MMWTKRSIQQLQGLAGQTKSCIRELFIRTAIPLDDKRRAWGQFLDESRDNTQYGVYGTSAGLQVLTLSEYSVDNTLIAGAILTLQDIFEVAPGDRVFLEHDDIFILYKMAYLAEATNPGQGSLSACKPVSEIIENVLPEMGWGEFFYSDREKDEHPKAVSTAIALLAICRYRDFRLQPACGHAIRWLCKRLLENGSIGPHEYALAALALHDYRDVGVNISEFPKAIETCKERLIEWARIRRKKDIGESKVYYYSTCMEGHRENRYLFFFPDCLVALALLKWDSPIDTRRYILRVINHFATQTLSKNGYIAKATGRMSSVDQLWIFRLMREFRTAPAEAMLPPYFFLWRGATTPIRIGLSIAFLILGLVGLLIGYLTTSTGMRITGGAIATIFLGLFGRTLWEFVIKADR